MLRRFQTLVILALVAAGPASGPSNRPEWTLREGASPALQGLIDRQPQVRPVAIQTLLNAIDSAKKELSYTHGAGQRAIRERIAGLNRQLADIRGRKVIATDAAMISPTQIDVGWAGAGLDPSLRCRVVSVIDDQSAVVDIVYQGQVGDIRHPVVVDKAVTFWLTGVSTAGWADEKRVELPSFLVAAGVHDTGRRTFIELRPFLLEDFVHHDDAPRQPDQKAPARRPR